MTARPEGTHRLDLGEVEGCLVDLEAVAEAAYAASGSPLTWAETGRPEHEQYRAIAAAALRAAGLTPGEPALHLVLAAIARRGWLWDHWRDHGTNGYGANVAPGDDWTTGLTRYADDPALALALAYAAAVRASEEAE